LPLALTPLLVLSSAQPERWWMRLARVAVAGAAIGAVVLLTSAQTIRVALNAPIAGHAISALARSEWQLVLALLAGVWLLHRWAQPPWLPLLGVFSLAATLATQASFEMHPMQHLSYQRLFWPGLLLGAAALFPRRLRTLSWGLAGGAAAAVTAWQSGIDPLPEARRAFERPVPRIPEAMWLADREMIDAAIDVSDGVLSDAAQIAAASRVRIIIETGRLPLHADADMNLGLAGGEDYELLFAAPPSLRDVAGQFATDVGTRITRIGEVAAGEGIRLRDEDGNEREPQAGGYTHFKGPAPGARED